MSLKELALQADVERRELEKSNATARKEASLDDLITQWNKRWSMRLDTPPEVPARDDFKWEKLTYGDGKGRHPTATGWSFVVDDVPFIYDREQGMCVILTCPDCSERVADTWYGMADLGKKLKTQRTLFHACHQVAARRLAFALRDAVNATGLPADVIYDDAVEIMRGLR